MTIVAYHGTDRMDFDRFDIAKALIYNIGLHFGTGPQRKAVFRFAKEGLLRFNSGNREERHDGS